MSHMPHSYDIFGPGTARGTLYSQDLLFYMAHTALELALKEVRRGSHPFPSPASIPDSSTKGRDIFFAPPQTPISRSGEKLLTLRHKTHTFPLARFCSLVECNGPFFQVIRHWRDTLARLTSDFRKSLPVKWRGQHRGSSIKGERPVNEWTPLSLSVCVCNRGQWQVNPQPLLLFILRRLVSGASAVWGNCVS